MTASDTDSLIQYPCRFPIKVMGAQHADFLPAVLEVVCRFEPGFDAASVRLTPSKNGNYLGLTVKVWVTQRAQLDDLYRALSGHPLVKVVL